MEYEIYRKLNNKIDSLRGTIVENSLWTDNQNNIIEVQKMIIDMNTNDILVNFKLNQFSFEILHFCIPLSQFIEKYKRVYETSLLLTEEEYNSYVDSKKIMSPTINAKNITGNILTSAMDNSIIKQIFKQ